MDPNQKGDTKKNADGYESMAQKDFADGEAEDEEANEGNDGVAEEEANFKRFLLIRVVENELFLI